MLQKFLSILDGVEIGRQVNNISRSNKLLVLTTKHRNFATHKMRDIIKP